MIIKNKYLYIFPATILIAGFLFLAGAVKVFASTPAITSFTLNGQALNATFNPNNGEKVTIGIIADQPVKFNTIAVCLASDSICSRTTAIKYFTQTTSSSSVSKDWDGKSSSSTMTVLAGEYKIKATIQISPDPSVSIFGQYSIFIDFSSQNQNSTSTATTTSSSGGTSTTTSTSTSTTTSSSSNGSSQTSKTSVRTVYISTHSSEEDLSDYNQIQIFETSAGRQRTAYIGVPIEFKVSYKIPKNMESNARMFKWSFGDGFEALGEKVIHSYKHPGEYNLVLNAELGDEHSVSRTLVNVLSPNISLTILPDNSIEISNIGNTEINLGLWKLKDTSNEFVIAEDTIIGAGKKIILSSEDTKINTQNKRISLNNPSEGEVSYINNTNDLTTVQAADDQSITVAKAEELYAEYKKSLALKSEQSTNSKNQNISKNIRQNQTPEETDLSRTASVIGSANGTSTAGFFSRIWRGSISGIKSVARLFYNF